MMPRASNPIEAASGRRPERRPAVAALMLFCAASCQLGAEQIELPPLPAKSATSSKPMFVCKQDDSRACEGNVHYACHRVGEFLQVDRIDCAANDQVCDIVEGCKTCAPPALRCQPCRIGDNNCDPNVVQECSDDGTAWKDAEVCDLTRGDACDGGRCRNMCQTATENRSYVGCEFFAVDLDNAAIDDLNNAAAQQFAVAVANPQAIAVDVEVEVNDAPFGEAPQPRPIQQAKVPPGGLEVFKLPQREVDGSIEGALNTGSHTALTSNAFRLTSTHPVSAYQFNPLENVNVFSNDASLLLPTSAVGSRYTVVSWPQTIGDSENPEQDFDATSSDEDLRAFLTIVGTQDAAKVKITLGNKVMQVVGAGSVPQSYPGDVLDFSINRFDVINLETAGLNADFTGSLIESDLPVVVFVGSEASDAPIFGTYATRQCCADHLEEQLIPDATLGSRFILARTPSRTAALAAASAPDEPLGIAVINEPEWVRVLAVYPGITTVKTTLPAPDDTLHLQPGEDVILKAEQDFLLEADRPVSVLQVMGSQGVTGIPREYPGGDPSIIVVPPIQQYRRDYIFLTPDKYAFDFVTIMADAKAIILLDGKPLPDNCQSSPGDGIERAANTPEPDWLIHRCQLSFPIVTRGPNSRVLPGEQHDGVHTIVSDVPAGIVVSGFDRFVSHAYPGGLNLDILN